MSLTRGGVQPRPQNGTSYSNRFVYAADFYIGAGLGETLQANMSGAVMAGLGYPPRVYPNGFFPMTVAVLAAGAI